MSKLVPLKLPPGVFRNGTQYQVKGRWFDCNLVRWKDGRMQPIGGWTQTIDSGVTGKGRSMLAWRDNASNKWLAIGTSSNLYAYSSLSGTPADITPSGFITGNDDAQIGLGFGSAAFNGQVITKSLAATDISVVTSTDKIITAGAVDFTSFFAAGDRIQAAGFTNSENNRTYSAAHRVVSVSSTELVVGEEDASTAYGGSTLVDESAGASVTLSRSRRFGDEDALSSSLVINAATWSFSTWGQILIALGTSDGKIYTWNAGGSNPTGTAASIISAAPASNSAILVSKERHLFAFGSGGDPRKVSWSDQEDYTSWTATATNQAGSFDLDTQGEILSARTVGDRIIVLTSVSAHAIDHKGPPFVYGRVKLADGCGLIAPQAIGTIGDQAFWMSDGGFWQYQGNAQPLQSEVSDYVFDDINRTQFSKIYCSINSTHFEVTWWYVSSLSTEVDRYATYNFREGWWSIGQLARLAWADAGVFDFPIAIDSNGIIYTHEQSASSSARDSNISSPADAASISTVERNVVLGTTTTTDPGLCYAESGGMEIGTGQQLTHLTQVITDSISGDNGLRLKFKSRSTPVGTETVSDAVTIASDGYSDARISGRQFVFRVESPWDQDWSVGEMRANISAGGSR